MASINEKWRLRLAEGTKWDQQCQTATTELQRPPGLISLSSSSSSSNGSCCDSRHAAKKQRLSLAPDLSQGQHGTPVKEGSRTPSLFITGCISTVSASMTPKCTVASSQAMTSNTLTYSCPSGTIGVSSNVLGNCPSSSDNPCTTSNINICHLGSATDRLELDHMLFCSAKNYNDTTSEPWNVSTPSTSCPVQGQGTVSSSKGYFDDERLSRSRQEGKDLQAPQRPSVIRFLPNEYRDDDPDVGEPCRKSFRETPLVIQEGSVDDHFARALGPMWWRFKEMHTIIAK